MSALLAQALLSFALKLQRSRSPAGRDGGHDLLRELEDDVDFGLGISPSPACLTSPNVLMAGARAVALAASGEAHQGGLGDVRTPPRPGWETSAAVSSPARGPGSPMTPLSSHDTGGNAVRGRGTGLEQPRRGEGLNADMLDQLGSVRSSWEAGGMGFPYSDAPGVDWEEFMDRQTCFVETRDARLGNKRTQAPQPLKLMSPGTVRILREMGAAGGSSSSGNVAAGVGGQSPGGHKSSATKGLIRFQQKEDPYAANMTFQPQVHYLYFPAALLLLNVL